MPVKSAVLDILVAARAEGLDAFGDAGRGARAMADDLSSAALEADSAAGKFDGVSASAENLDDKAGRATGAMGALGSGLALVGADQAAAGLEAAAMATDFLSGAGQALNLILDLEIVKKTTAAATTLAYSAASKTAAAGQLALNAALSLNPIGIVVIAVAALVAGLVLAYNKSETFRDIVDGAMSKARNAVDTVSDAFSTVVDWVGDKVPAGIETLKNLAVLSLKVAFAPLVVAYESAQLVAEFLREKLPGAVDVLKDRASSALDTAFHPIEVAIGWVNDLVSAIGKIDFPDPPDWLNKIPGLGRIAAPLTGSPEPVDLLAASQPRGGIAASVINYVTIEVKQTVGDPVAAAREIRAILARADNIVVVPT